MTSAFGLVLLLGTSTSANATSVAGKYITTHFEKLGFEQPKHCFMSKPLVRRPIFPKANRWRATWVRLPSAMDPQLVRDRYRRGLYIRQLLCVHEAVHTEAVRFESGFTANLVLTPTHTCWRLQQSLNVGQKVHYRVTLIDAESRNVLWAAQHEGEWDADPNTEVPVEKEVSCPGESRGWWWDQPPS